jgi:two-component system chemotaxis response regulator CheB
LLRALPLDFPLPIAVVLHMPEGYTDSFARRVNSDCELEVMEAYDGLALKPGRAIVARAGVHLVFQREGEGWGCKLDALPLGLAHRPAVDITFRSGAALAGAGVVLTGMGSDGLAGSRAIREAGGQVLTEAEASCVVYGMPRSVFDAGLSNAVAPIESMAALILQHL